jgi:DNA-binding GntR family transcriptional regulator
MATKAEQITIELRRRLASGEYEEGDKIESFAELQRRYGVDGVATIQTALAPLWDEGVLRGEQGRGTFVQRIPSPWPEAGADADEKDVVAEASKILAEAVAELARLGARLEATQALLAATRSRGG